MLFQAYHAYTQLDTVFGASVTLISCMSKDLKEKKTGIMLDVVFVT